MTKFRRAALAAVLAVTLPLAACSRDDAAAPAPASSPVPTAVGGGSDIVLSPLAAADIDAAALPGELVCSFTGADGAVLLLARGDVASDAPALGVVKAAGHAERLAAPGGFGGMLRGATFAGRDMTVRIVLTGPPAGGGESPPRPATLGYRDADGAESAWPGQWTCGP